CAKTAAGGTQRAQSVSSHDVMAVDPNLLVVAPRPMSRPPNIVRVACVITRAVNVVWPVTNRDRDRGWVTTIVGSAVIRSTIIGSVARLGGIIAFAATHPKRHTE